MAKETKITIDLSKLEGLRRKIKTDLIARVGIMGQEAQKQHYDPINIYDTKTGERSRQAGKSAGGLTNAELGVIHEFGSATRNIPPRSFLRMPIETKGKEIVQLLAGKETRELIKKGELLSVFTLLGIKGEEIVQRAFETKGFGQWPPNKPATVDRKGSSAPLIDTGQLRRSITSDVVKK